MPIKMLRANKKESETHRKECKSMNTTCVKVVLSCLVNIKANYTSSHEHLYLSICIRQRTIFNRLTIHQTQTPAALAYG